MDQSQSSSLIDQYPEYNQNMEESIDAINQGVGFSSIDSQSGSSLFMSSVPSSVLSLSGGILAERYSRLEVAVKDSVTDGKDPDGKLATFTNICDYAEHSMENELHPTCNEVALKALIQDIQENGIDPTIKSGLQGITKSKFVRRDLNLYANGREKFKNKRVLEVFRLWSIQIAEILGEQVWWRVTNRQTGGTQRKSLSSDKIVAKKIRMGEIK